jgi:hypothetical protein
MSVLIKVLRVPLFCISVLLLPMQAVAEDVPIVDGILWMQSSGMEKRSYIIGAGNFIAMEYAYQSKSEQPPTPYQSSVPDFFRHTDDVTLDEVIEAADGWYKSHPDEMDTPVLTVIWDTLVKPKLK